MEGGGRKGLGLRLVGRGWWVMVSCRVDRQDPECDVISPRGVRSHCNMLARWSGHASSYSYLEVSGDQVKPCERGLDRRLLTYLSEVSTAQGYSI